MSVARTAKEDAMAWLKMEDIDGDVGSSDVFRKHFAYHVGGDLVRRCRTSCHTLRRGKNLREDSEF